MNFRKEFPDHFFTTISRAQDAGPLCWRCCRAMSIASSSSQAQQFDLLLKGGHVIDPKNGRDGVMDVAITGAKIAQVAPNIPAASARLDDRRQRPLRDTRPGGRPHARLRRHRRDGLVRRRQQHLSGLLRAAHGRDDGRRRRQLGLEKLPGLQVARHRSIHDARARDVERRRQRHGTGRDGTDDDRHGRRGDGASREAVSRTSSSA